jgi:hypothetical protein
MDKKYKEIYSKNGLQVFVNPEDFWADYKVKLHGHNIVGLGRNGFKGETAWMNVTRWVHDQAMEFWDFNLDEINDRLTNDIVKEIEKRFTDAGL